MSAAKKHLPATVKLPPRYGSIAHNLVFDGQPQDDRTRVERGAEPQIFVGHGKGQVKFLLPRI